MKRRALLKDSVFGVAALSLSPTLMSWFPAHNWTGYDFGSGPEVKDRLYDRPEYSIRLANEGVAFTKEGYNDLGWTLKVTDEEKPAHHSFLRFSKF